MMHRVRRVGVAQLAKVMGVLYFAMGALLGVCFWAFSALIPSAGAGLPFSGMGFGIGILVAMPIIYAVMGVVFGALTAWLYNIVAGWVGGVELDLEPT